MNSLNLLKFVFICTITAVNTQEDCTTPMQTLGSCVVLQDCQPLYELYRSRHRTLEGTRLLKNSRCGRHKRQPKVCCEQQTPLSAICTTPDGYFGDCIGLFKCPTLKALFDLPKPLSKDVVTYLKQSSCKGSDKYSVCCNDETPSVAPPRFNPKSLLPLRSTCGVHPSIDRVTGGDVAGIDEYPWMALIEYKGKKGVSLSCGGSLITQRYVLTAAHCVTGSVLTKVGTPTNIRLGEYDSSHDGPDCVRISAKYKDCNDGTTIIKIEKIISHVDYNVPVLHQNDIALIRMEKEAPEDSFYIAPVCLPQSDVKEVDFTVAGWGVSETGRSSDKKLFVKLPFVDLKTCQVAFTHKPNIAHLSEKQICAGGQRGKDACRGDSGGPLMYKFNAEQFELIGIVSFGAIPCGREGVPGVYTKVHSYMPWILQNLKP